MAFDDARCSRGCPDSQLRLPVQRRAALRATASTDRRRTGPGRRRSAGNRPARSGSLDAARPCRPAPPCRRRAPAPPAPKRSGLLQAASASPATSRIALKSCFIATCPGDSPFGSIAVINDSAAFGNGSCHGSKRRPGRVRGRALRAAPACRLRPDDVDRIERRRAAARPALSRVNMMTRPFGAQVGPSSRNDAVSSRSSRAVGAHDADVEAARRSAW